MSIVTLVSGGLDSSLMALLIRETGSEQRLLFVDYGQKARDRELHACRTVTSKFKLPEPVVANLGGFGSLIQSGLTDPKRDVVDEAFTPGRNAMFLLVGASYAVQIGADSVSIGLLDERYHLFPDQTRAFLEATEEFLFRALGQQIAILAPLMTMSKYDVVQLAKARGVSQTYSCHQGGPEPCGVCIACKEFEGTES